MPGRQAVEITRIGKGGVAAVDIVHHGPMLDGPKRRRTCAQQKAMLIEFDYDGKLIPSFPFIDPLKELWVSWLIEEKGLYGAYRAMLRGRA